MSGPPVVLTTNARPVTNIISERGAVPMVVVNTLGEPVTLVNSGGEPVTLLNPNGTLWDYPFSLFANAEQGAWYDPSDFSTLYQTSTGTTPVTAVEQPVGLMLDRSRGLVLGSELLSNPGGPYTATTGWSAGFGVTTSTLTAASGLLTLTLAGSDTVPRFAIPITGLTSGRSYKIQLTGCAATGTGDRYGVWTPSSNGTGGTTFNQVTVAGWVGAIELVLTATATTMYLAVGMLGAPTVASTLSIASASVRELPGNHATQATSTSRPVLRARYNLLTRSEEFNTTWSLVGLQAFGSGSTPNAGVAPNGTTTADLITETSANSRHFTFQLVNVAASTTYTYSVYLKYSTKRYAVVSLKSYTGSVDVVAYSQVVDVQNRALGAATNTSGAPTNTSSSIELLADGWCRVNITMNTGAGGVLLYSSVCLSDSATPSYVAEAPSYTGDGTSGILIWGAQLLTAADQTATGGAYQRIAAATDYDTSNPVFRPYLAFDGVDDFMSLASAISITTDMTVVRGFGRSAAGIVSVGIGDPSDAAYDALWAIDDKTYLKLGGTTLNVANGSTSTGYFVISSLRNVTNQFFRRNGTQISSVSAPAVSGTLPEFGRRGSSYNSGPIYGFIVLNRELTGSELTATEQWMAGKTGATLA